MEPSINHGERKPIDSVGTLRKKTNPGSRDPNDGREGTRITVQCRQQDQFLPFYHRCVPITLSRRLISNVPTHTQHINASYPEDHAFSGWKTSLAAV